jgi:hypothetical protein
LLTGVQEKSLLFIFHSRPTVAANQQHVAR